MPDPCVFCEIVHGRAPATIVADTDNTLMIVPLGPVNDSHILAIPKTHVRDAAEWPELTATVMADVARYAAEKGTPFNLITSAGREATQSIFHLHVHYLSRAADDQLMVPWGTLHGENPQDPHRCKGMVALQTQLAQVRRW